MAGPIKPKEVQKKKNEKLPEEVFKVFNDLIVEKWNGYSATVVQKEAATRVAAALKITTGEVYERHLLDVEDAYAKAGWNVEYDKPGYNETYEATFKFWK